jgi:hypothetical protein
MENQKVNQQNPKKNTSKIKGKQIVKKKERQKAKNKMEKKCVFSIRRVFCFLPGNKKHKTCQKNANGHVHCFPCVFPF